MTTRAASPNPFLEDFAAHAAELPGAGLPWLDARRADAIKLVRANGLPNRRVEGWKYSDLRQSLESPSDLAADTYVDPREGIGFSSVVGPEATFTDGQLSEKSLRGLSLWDGVEIYDLSKLGDNTPEWVSRNLGSAQNHSGVMGDASLALMRSGLAIHVAEGVQAPVPLHLGFRSRVTDVGFANHSRVLLVLEAGASLTLLEAHAEQRFANLGIEILLQPGAKLRHARVSHRAANGQQVENVFVSVAAGAEYRCNSVQWGARLSRLEFSIILDGPKASASLAGASILTGHLHADVTTHIEHAAADTTSRQIFKNVANGRSRGVYQGKITVREGADGSDSHQTAKGLLLSPGSEIDLKPELEIYADDVKCAHGAAVGDLDVESLFYLRSRGIPEAEARALLIRAFLEEAFDGIEREDVRADMWKAVEMSLSHAVEVTS